MRQNTQARRFYVSGTVHGVGFRFFAERMANRLGISGYVKNLRDGRVEVYAIGSPAQLDSLRHQLERGPRSASVSDVAEDDAPVDANHTHGFSIEHDDG